MIASGYSIDLYCDNQESKEHRYDEFPHQYYDEERSVCRTSAKQDGWKVNWIKGTAICPKCAKSRD